MAYSTVPVSGRLCRVEKNNVLFTFSEGWNLNIQAEFIDSTYQGDTWASNLKNIQSWDGDFDVAFVPGNTEQIAIVNHLLSGTAVLTDMKFLLETTTSGFNGDIWVESCGVKTATKDKVTMNVKFKGNGALAISASQ